VRLLVLEGVLFGSYRNSRPPPSSRYGLAPFPPPPLSLHSLLPCRPRLSGYGTLTLRVSTLSKANAAADEGGGVCPQGAEVVGLGKLRLRGNRRRGGGEDKRG